MSDAVVALAAFTLGCVASYYVLREVLGARKWRDGYLHGFNYAWDEKAKVEEAAKHDRLKRLRKTGPKLHVIKGEKK